MIKQARGQNLKNMAHVAKKSCGLPFDLPLSSASPGLDLPTSSVIEALTAFTVFNEIFHQRRRRTQRCCGHPSSSYRYSIHENHLTCHQNSGETSHKRSVMCQHTPVEEKASSIDNGWLFRSAEALFHEATGLLFTLLNDVRSSRRKRNHYLINGCIHHYDNLTSSPVAPSVLSRTCDDVCKHYDNEKMTTLGNAHVRQTYTIKSIGYTYRIPSCGGKTGRKA